MEDDKLLYLMKFLGKKRPVMEQEIEDDHPSVNHSTLLMMLAKDLNEEDTDVMETEAEQLEVETAIKDIYDDLLEQGITNKPLQTSRHMKYLEYSLTNPLPHYFKALDASHPWMLYWITNSNYLLKNVYDQHTKNLITAKLKTCLNESGGFGGGKGQISHVAATYAAVLTLIIVEDFHTLNEIRPAIYNWLLKLKNSDGSFSMHVEGERDTRATYCVVVVGSLLNLLTQELVDGTAEWIASCQTYEGGFAGVPYTEAHGGYSFCAVASLCILDEPRKLRCRINLDSLIRWCVSRQYQLEGGLSGRTNKLVDACYSHWIGSIFPLLEMATSTETLFNRSALQTYLLNCCQEEKFGGFIDKPGKSQDFYHTNYSLCGLSTCQHQFTFNIETYKSVKDKYGLDSAAYCIDTKSFETADIIEVEKEIVGINPIFGVPMGIAENCKQYFVC